MNEVLNTSGSIRRFIAQSMMDIKTGEMDISRGMTIAALSKELTSSMQAEINAMKANLLLQAAGQTTTKLSHMGQMLIGDDNVPTLDGRAQQ